MESVKKHLKSLTELHRASKSLLLQQTTSITETFSAETQSETTCITDIVASWRRQTLKADENSEVSSKITNDFVITLFR